ncbi:hypothetical protein P154DRAFT_605165 [Amniculicola lignicola CBS 123094]|uniref:Uncharacterized protein n=1 Tax=Amniculicola lignicola CBS 123094 TaxID=1392246 RepID=A0A6A5W7F8_9PLEO|nr:hypothetical protein P154DRAFT_605165 [Amniculicola lignicola CBS 123094]
MDAEKKPHNVSKTQLPATETDIDAEPTSSTPERKRRLPATAKAWIILFIHGACCITLALSIALGLDGYEAGDQSSPHRVEGKVLLRVGDITTLVSVALVIVKISAGTWSTIVLWAFGRHILTRKSAPSIAVSRMIRWRLPPGLRNLKYILRDFRGWIISVTVITVFIQQFTGPILTGSVNWNTAFHVSKEAVNTSSVAQTANFSLWPLYDDPELFDKKLKLKVAAGYANLAWADTSAVDAQGKSLVGNGCRHVVNNDGLPQNSTLVNATLPCINIKSIRWYRDENEVVGDEWSISGSSLTLIGDNPYDYFTGGVTTVYDTENLREPPDSHDKPPPANKFSGTMTVSLMLARRENSGPPCSKLPNTIFGDIGALPPYLIETARSNNCFLLGKIDFTAGVTKSSRATYINSRVVEDATPIQDVVFEADSWVQEAIWLLPDLLAMISISNVSQLPTYHNIDNYVNGIVRQGFLGAWDMLHYSFDDNQTHYDAFPASARLVADSPEGNEKERKEEVHGVVDTLLGGLAS